MSKRTDIKVNAPSSNPHICYIPRSMEKKIKYAKNKTGLSMYRILSESAGFSLSKKENIQDFKELLRAFGYKTIGEWAVVLLEDMYNNKDGVIPAPYSKEKEQ